MFLEEASVEPSPSINEPDDAAIELHDADPNCNTEAPNDENVPADSGFDTRIALNSTLNIASMRPLATSTPMKNGPEVSSAPLPLNDISAILAGSDMQPPKKSKEAPSARISSAPSNLPGSQLSDILASNDMNAVKRRAPLIERLNEAARDIAQALQPPPPASAPLNSSAPGVFDPAALAATVKKIQKNTKTYKKYAASRSRARKSYDETHESMPRQRTLAAVWFRDAIRNVDRRVHRAAAIIKRYNDRGKWPKNATDWYTRQRQDEELRAQLEKRKLLHNTLVLILRNRREVLDRTYADGYSSNEIYQHFFYWPEEIHRTAFLAALEALNADMSYWHGVLESQQSWNLEFGVDSRFRHAGAEWYESDPI